MLKHTFVALSLILSTSSIAQRLTSPMKSPHQKVMHTIGISQVSVDYHSPAVNEREIWGKVVPYGEVWRAGANENTIFYTQDTLAINGNLLPAGLYGVHVIPTENEWTLILSTNTTAWGSYTYNEKEDVMRVKMKTESTTHQERMRFGFENYTDSSATMFLSWGEKKASVELTLDVHEIVTRSMRDELRGYAGFFWRSNYQAAKYCMDNGVNLEEGFDWAKTALRREENFNTLRLVADYHQNRGEEAQAKEHAEKAFELATERDLTRYAYRLEQSGDTKGLMETLEMSAEKFPESWMSAYNLADAQAEAGDKKAAMKGFKKALKLAPEDRKELVEKRMGEI